MSSTASDNHSSSLASSCVAPSRRLPEGFALAATGSICCAPGPRGGPAGSGEFCGFYRRPGEAAAPGALAACVWAGCVGTGLFVKLQSVPLRHTVTPRHKPEVRTDRLETSDQSAHQALWSDVRADQWQRRTPAANP
ncbi:hypothetical protein EYF80_032414 [Liparis tanakae]|uniref:Uncharacterized protein n=1 Tax=Liparis tanakae TaxID=230148 RepID=A0A4Z2GUW6_9TELE|nr:hypothetical protein EYF80_032414 [Liparis tanakae]